MNGATCLQSVVESLYLEGFSDDRIAKHFSEKLRLSVSRGHIAKMRSVLGYPEQATRQEEPK